VNQGIPYVFAAWLQLSDLSAELVGPAYQRSWAAGLAASTRQKSRVSCTERTSSVSFRLSVSGSRSAPDRELVINLRRGSDHFESKPKTAV
jgi:hypothetical protein